MRIRDVYHRLTYPLDVALSRADAFVIRKLREKKWLNVLIGVCLTYACVGVWLIWSAWLTREADDLVFGVVHTCIGVIWATILALRHSIHTRIDAYAVRAIREQAWRDELLVSPVGDLWSQSDALIERYLETAVEQLQAHGFIPFIDGAIEDLRYEDLINDKAQELYERDAPLSG